MGDRLLASAYTAIAWGAEPQRVDSRPDPSAVASLWHHRERRGEVAEIQGVRASSLLLLVALRELFGYKGRSAYWGRGAEVRKAETLW